MGAEGDALFGSRGGFLHPGGQRLCQLDECRVVEGHQRLKGRVAGNASGGARVSRRSIEGQEARITALAEALGFQPADYLTSSYSGLHAERGAALGLGPHMLFPA